ncbi:MAG: hypothetical protein IIB89_07420 [Chloroflexi bacterium]|nr:hypothetical protein [Chloroflexota bacterium]
MKRDIHGDILGEGQWTKASGGAHQPGYFSPGVPDHRRWFNGVSLTVVA